MKTSKSKCPDVRLTTSLSSFEMVRDVASTNGVIAHIARQYMTMYRYAQAKVSPTILELGTREGISTSVFLKACQENGGKVVSVDIDDCSSVSQDGNWKFVQSDSTEIKRILEAAPILAQGVDILLIDSLHLRSHVEKEFFSWYPYLKTGAVVLFDDIDPFIYRLGNRKDNLHNEITWQDIQDFVIEIFRANEDTMQLTMHFGSSGLAILVKNAPLGDVVNVPPRQIYRDRLFFYRARHRFAQLKAHLVNQLMK